MTDSTHTTGSTHTWQPDGDAHGVAPRPLWRAIRRGLGCRCPNCGDGRLFSGFTRTVDACEACGEEIHHHRADDLPAYLNIFVTGHIVVAGFMAAEVALDWSPWAHLALWVPMTLVLTVLLIQPIKGAVVGLQWANRMHGFGGESDDVADPDMDDGHG